MSAEVGSSHYVLFELIREVSMEERSSVSTLFLQKGDKETVRLCAVEAGHVSDRSVTCQ